MASTDKLPLLQTALKLLTAQLSAQDKVSIVVYAGAAGVVLDGASGNDTQTLTYALEAIKCRWFQPMVVRDHASLSIGQKAFYPQWHKSESSSRPMVISMLAWQILMIWLPWLKRKKIMALA